MNLESQKNKIKNINKQIKTFFPNKIKDQLRITTTPDQQVIIMLKNRNILDGRRQLYKDNIILLQSEVVAFILPPQHSASSCMCEPGFTG